MTTTFDLIKKQNGEAFAKAIRSYDNGIFDIPEIADIVQYAGRNAEPIMDFLISLKNINYQKENTKKSVEELLSDAGYDSYYADTLQKQNAIAPYFEKGEELCTFRDTTRYQRYHIINAVKKDVNEIRRKDFPKPEREDRYGTSVISIQVLKTGGFISIKNRYNHIVENPDNTFSSNPDNIILGLGDAIRRQFNVDFSSQKVPLPDNYTVQNGRIFKYHREAQNIYFGDGFWVEDGQISTINPDHQILCDTVVLDLKEKRFFSPDLDEKTVALLNDEIKEKKLSVRTDRDKKSIYLDDKLFMEVAKDGSQILSLNLEKTTHLPNKAFKYIHLKSLNIPNLEEMGSHCFLGGIEQIHTTKKVLVKGDLDVSRQDLNVLPDFSNFVVDGSFYCGQNNLTSLKGSPRLVKHDFGCSFNRLTDLTGCPLVGKDFNCSHSQISSLKGIQPVINGSFHCDNNNLQNYDYFPQTDLHYTYTEGNPAGRYGALLRKGLISRPKPEFVSAEKIVARKNLILKAAELFFKKHER